MRSDEPIKLYQPSNATEGDFFMSAFCFRCSKWRNGHCGIQLRTMAFGIKDKEYPRQWRYVDDDPTCTAFKHIDEHNAERRKKLRPSSDKATIDFFEAAAEIGAQMGGV